jgi:hypothetical protein
MSGREGLPGGDLALAALAEGDGGVQRLLHRLEDHLLLQPEQRTDARRRRRPEMGDVIHLVLMQADGAYQIHLNFVPGGDAANQVSTRLLHRLRDGQDRRDVVAGVRVVGGEEGVVHIQLAHRRAIRPGRPFRAEALRGRQAEDGGAALARMPHRHRARRCRACRLMAAMATEALSMIRLMIMSATGFCTATLSVATPAIFHASWSSRFSSALDG